MKNVPTMREILDRVDAAISLSLYEESEVIHYKLDHQEHIADRGGKYVDPDRYRSGHKDYRPEMKCHTGDGHAKGTRDWSKVTCPRCLAKKR